MPKVLTTDQADKIIPSTKRDRSRQMAALERREREAISEIERLGFRTTLFELPRYEEADPLLGVAGGYKSGNYYGVMYGRDGKRKHVSGSSAVEALQDAQTWLRFQATLKDAAPNKFVPSVGNEFVPESSITQNIAGDTATTAARKAIHRTLEYSPTGELIDVKESK